MSQFDLFGKPLANSVAPVSPPVPESPASLGQSTPVAKPPRKPRARRVASPGSDVPAAESLPVEPATEVVSMGDWLPAPKFASVPDGAPVAPRRKLEGEVLPAVAALALRELAAQLPEGLRLGTSSWTCPGWAGLVYRDTQSETQLSRKGLSAYAHHPLLRSVGTGYYDSRSQTFIF